MNPNQNPSSILPSIVCLLPAVLTIIVGLSIFLSSPLFAPIDFDSVGYLNFAPQRSSFYPLFLNIWSNPSESVSTILLIQSLIYLVTIFYLLHNFLKIKKSAVLTVLIGLGIALNLYLQAFNTIILTESITFSLMNVLVTFVLKLSYQSEKNKSYLFVLIGVVAGFLFGVRPAMVTVLPAVLIVVFFVLKSDSSRIYKPLFLILLTFLSVALLEKVLHRTVHEKSISLLPTIMFGKATILTTYPEFEIPTNLSIKQKQLIEDIDDLFQPFEAWITENENILQTSNIRANIEVFGQFSALPILRRSNPELSLTDEEKSGLGAAILIANFGNYLKLSISNILELWSVQSLAFAKKVIGKNLPVFENRELNKVLPNVFYKGSPLDPESAHFVNVLSIIVYPTFIILGLFSLASAIFSWFFVLNNFVINKVSTCPDILLIAALQLIGWSNLIFIAFINIPTPRYLMPHFTLFLISVAIVFLRFISWRKNKFFIEGKANEHRKYRGNC